MIPKTKLPGQNVHRAHPCSINVSNVKRILQCFIVDSLNTQWLVLQAFDHDYVQDIDDKQKTSEGYKPDTIRRLHFKFLILTLAKSVVVFLIL